MKSLSVTIQMKAIEQYVRVVECYFPGTCNLKHGFPLFLFDAMDGFWCERVYYSYPYQPVRNYVSSAVKYSGSWC